jgi:energy-coupling factor transporter ATP-binding protein EcfA2
MLLHLAAGQTGKEAARKVIDVKDLRKKTFGDHLEVLEGITEHIDKGEKVVVIGPSGCGKSTFLRCLNLLEIPTGAPSPLTAPSSPTPRPTSTPCAADGHGVPALQPVPPHDGAEEHHAGPHTAQGPDEAGRGRQGHAAAGARGPGRQGGLLSQELSGGQKQRIAIVRALAMRPGRDAVRRAHLRPRPRDGGRGAGGDEGAGPRPA